MNELYEKLAAIEHERWADWQQGLHNLCTKNAYGALTIPPEKVARYEWLIETKYADLPEEEKAKDRPQVDRYWHLIPHWIPVSEPPKKAGMYISGNPERPDTLSAELYDAEEGYLFYVDDTHWMEIPK